MDLKLIATAAASAIALTSLAGCSETSAQEQPAQQQKQQPGDKKMTVESKTKIAPGDIRQVTLTVKDINRAEHKVMFEARVRPEANIMHNGQPMKIDELMKGDSLTVSFDPATGEIVKAEVMRKARD